MAIVSNLDSNITSSSAVGSTTNFSIQADSALYSVLTKKIYSDTMSASIREWSTNALDACIAADLEIKFDVHIPTIENPTFIVRDYGIGLHKDDIVGLFTVVGASTKRNSNKFNGQFGLGRLAGLAYSQSFTVESYHNGIYYSYLISIQDGVPIAVQLAEQPTTESNGLKLSLPVEPQDLQTFRTKAIKIYKYFEVKPTFNIELDLATNITVKSDDWFIDTSLESYNNYILMSNVVYKIPRDASINTFNLEQLVLKIPTGSAAINPGRESLSLDQATIKTINTKFELITNEFKQIITDSIMKQSTPYLRLQTFYTAIGTMPWKIRQTYSYPDTACLVRQKMFDKYFCIKGVVGNVNFRELNSWYKSARNLKSNTVNANSLTDYAFIITDTKSRFLEAARLYHDSISKKVLLLVREDKSQDLDEFTAEAKQLLDDLGVDYVFTSGYEVEVTKSTNSRDAGIYVSLAYHGGLFQSELANADSYWYIPASGTTPDVDNYAAIYEAYNLITGDKPPLVGVPKKYQPAVKASNAFTLAIPAIQQALDKQQFYAATSNILQDNISSYITAIDIPQDFLTYIADCKAYKAARDKHQFTHYSKLTIAQQVFNITPIIYDSSVDYKTLMDKYSILLKMRQAYGFKLKDYNKYLQLEHFYDTAHQDDG